MTAELVRGQNHVLPDARLEIRVSAGEPVLAGAVLVDSTGSTRGTDWIAHPGAPQLPGLEVPRQAAVNHRLAVDLEALPEDAVQVRVLLALPQGVGGPLSFASLAAPFLAVTSLEGAELASYTIIGLGSESAVIAVELYRRGESWKVRAVGQGYAEGLAALLHDQGLPESAELASGIHAAIAGAMARSVPAPPPRQTAPVGGEPASNGALGPDGTGHPQPGTAGSQSGAPGPGPAASTPHGGVNYQHPGRRATAPPPPPPTAPAPEPGRPAQPVAGDAAGWSMNERLYNQVWGMFEDLARTTAAHRSAVDFADSRMEQELDKVLSDPATRSGPAAEAAREAARAKHTDLLNRAREVLDRDLAQLVEESRVVEPALPPEFARWDNPVWHAYQVPMEIPMALRLGDLSLPERTDLRVPMLTRLPLERGLWIDSGHTGRASAELDSDELRRRAGELATALAGRLLAVYPAGEFSVQVIDAAGSNAATLAPLTTSGVLKQPPASGAGGVGETLAGLTKRVDLVQMAVRSRALDSLPPDLDTAEQLLIVHDFPHGFDDRAITQLRYLADEGPAVGVHLLLVADREEASAYGPLLDPLWRALLRVTPVPDDHLIDPWVGHQWTYEPPLVPANSQILPQVLNSVAEARRRYGR
ncbi:TerD family protein [Streptomyces sp. XM4193]|uniref:TerD family protein n=1 Tax=Streptomyces sp. XM4193 TaxID=2929782 RepID=UPI001FFA3B27|nr:TerD family protein [Streptomyces sp. XM4193]MCK1796459.1 TerD family protein [Streptomyces sp. XM4193]